jgi:hypothetical protein
MNASNIFHSWRNKMFNRLTTERRPKGIDAELEKARAGSGKVRKKANLHERDQRHLSQKERSRDIANGNGGGRKLDLTPYFIRNTPTRKKVFRVGN